MRWPLLLVPLLATWQLSSPSLDAISEPILDMLEQDEVKRCDLRLLSDRESFFSPKSLQILHRPVMIVRNEPYFAPFPYKKCIVHIVGLSGWEATRYVAAAWEADKIGANDFYVLVFENHKTGMEFLGESREASGFENLVIMAKEPEGFNFHTALKIRSQSGQSKILKVASWRQGPGFLGDAKVFPDKYADLQGNTLRITHHDTAMFFFNAFTYNNGTVVRDGIDKSLMEYIAHAMNFKIKWIKNPDGKWGVIVDEEAKLFSGLVGMVQRGEADIAGGALTITAPREEVIDFSYPYFEEKIGFVSQKATPLPKFLAVMWPFRKEVWLFLFCSALAFMWTYWAAARFSRLRCSYVGGGIACFHVLAAIFGRSVHRWGTTEKVRILFTLWVGASLILTFAYSGNLIAMLTYPVRPKPLNTFEDVLRKEIPVVVFQESFHEEFLETSTDATIRAIHQRILAQGEHMSHWMLNNNLINRVLDENVVAICDINYTELEIAGWYTSLTGETDLHISQFGVYPSGFGYAMTSKAPYKRTLNKWVKRAMQFGLVDKWISDARLFLMEFRRVQKMNGVEVSEYEVKFPTDQRAQSFTLNNLQGPFYLLIIGFGLGAVTLFIETHMRRKLSVRTTRRI